ncbi:hypothetical protein M444_29660 [Streptomyces sp. Mg1]|nr:hypothetical protein M444_29660 [Streptomyces sp. Mg1]
MGVRGSPSAGGEAEPPAVRFSAVRFPARRSAYGCHANIRPPPKMPSRVPIRNPPRFDRTSAAVAMRVVRIPARTRCGGANQPVRPSTIRTAPIRTDGIPATPCWSMIFNGASGRTQIQAPERRVRSPPQNGLLRRHRLQRCQDQDRDRDPDRASFRDRDSVRDRDRRRLRSIPSCPC